MEKEERKVSVLIGGGGLASQVFEGLKKLAKVGKGGGAKKKQQKGVCLCFEKKVSHHFVGR